MDHDFGTLPNSGRNQENLTTSVAAGRPTISVVIDEDEDTQEEIELQSGDRIHGVLMSNGSQTVERHSKESANFDHNYIAGGHVQLSGPGNVHFPIIIGLESYEMDEFSTRQHPRAQHLQQQPVKRLNVYGYSENDRTLPMGRDAYYLPQTKHSPVSVANSQSQQQQFQRPQPVRRLPSTLRPAYRGRTTAATNQDDTYGVRTTMQRPEYPSMGTTNSGFDGSPAPIVTTARGRPPGSKNAKRTDVTQIQRRDYGTDKGISLDYASPPAEDAYHSYTMQRKAFNPQQKRQSSTYRREPAEQQQIDDHNDDYLEEEEKLNQTFLDQLSSKTATSGRGRRPRSPKKSTAPADPIQHDSELQDSKPPDDPFLPPQQPLQQTGLVEQRHSSDSTLDGTIAAVVRGEASVMQQHFGPPQIPHQHFQSSQHPTHQQYKFTQSYQKHFDTNTPPPQLMSHQRLDELAELAQASSTLIEQTTSSMARNVVYQQQLQHFQPPEQLHFKVVQTSHNEEPYPQDYREQQQQVFTVQQRREENLQTTVPGQQLSATNERKRRPRNSSTLETELMQQPGTSNANFRSKKKDGQTSKRRSLKRNLDEKPQPAELASAEAKTDEQLADGKKIKSEPMKWKKTKGYTTRCICGMIHNDPFMIQCDNCDVWQHGACMGISPKAVPDVYNCEECNPRELKILPKQAQNIQKRILAQIEANKRRKKATLILKNKRAHLSKSKQPKFGIRRMKAMKPSKSQAMSRKHTFFKKTAPNEHPNFFETMENQYSRGIRTMAANMQPYVLGDIGLLKCVAKTPLARQMFVAPNVEGLVATSKTKTSLPIGMPIIEYSGSISLLSEAMSRAPNKPVRHDHTLIYSQLDEKNQVFVDATKRGSVARAVRRSCRPNAFVQHAVIDGRLRIFLYANAIIDDLTEITIPFDYNYRELNHPVVCACGREVDRGNMHAEDRCPVREFGQSIQNKSYQPSNLATTSVPIPMQPKQQQATNSSGESTNVGLADTARKRKAGEAPSIKTEMPSPVKEEAQQQIDTESTDQDGRRFRTRTRKPTQSEFEPSTTNVAHERVTRRSTRTSTSASEQAEPVKAIKEDSPTREDTAPPSRRKLAVSSASSSNPVQAKSAAGISSSISPVPKKRGRPPAKTPTTSSTSRPLKEPKMEEIASETVDTEKMSREERKLQATIAAFERSEQSKEGKRRQSDSKSANPTQERTLEQKPSSSRKSFQEKVRKDKNTNSWAELSRQLKQKIKEEDFVLPKEFDDLRAKLEEGKRPSNREKGKPNTRSIADTKTLPTKEVEHPVDKSGNAKAAVEEKGQEEQGRVEEQQIPNVQSSVDQEESLSLSETARQPNTKERKKLTIAEYRRKKQAEMAAGDGGDTNSKAQPTQTSAAAYPTRQSPRKSFIPTMPSSPQQLDDFDPQISPSIGNLQQNPQQFCTPSLDELKRRILENSSGASSSRSDEDPQGQLSPLPSDPSASTSSQRTSSSLDERLKKLVKRGT